MERRDIPETLHYWLEDGKVREHVWVRLEGDSAYIGLTDIGIELMGDVVSLSPMAVGQEIEAGKGIASVESSKWVGPISTPVKGTIVEVNRALVDTPSRINSDPYGSWIVKLAPSSGDLPAGLVTGADGASAYLEATARDLPQEG